MRSNKITGANAGGPSRLPIRTCWGARIAQFCRYAVRARADSRLVLAGVELGPPKTNHTLLLSSHVLDPSLPADNAPIVSGELSCQFQAIQAKN
jgi:hypothetical protein